jgi:hypothetical protein
VVGALAKVLKPQHCLLIFEPTQPSHGMAINEIRKEMTQAGLKEIESEIKKGTFLGVFQRISA